MNGLSQNERTDEERDPLVKEQKRNFYLKISDADKKTINFCLDRYMDMKRHRPDRMFARYQKQFESIIVPYQNGRIHSNVPIERAITEHFVAESQKRPCEFTVSSVGSVNPFGVESLQKTFEYDFSRFKRKNSFIKDDYIASVFGTSVIGCWQTQDIRVLKDKVRGTKDYVYNKETKSYIVFENIDIRDFYIDNRVTDFNKATDCIHRITMPIDQFEQLKFNPNYKNIEQITGGYGEMDRRVFRTKEESYTKENNVEILTYYNRLKDRQISIANRQIIIRDTELLNPTHELPFAVRQLMHNNFSIYGNGFCEAVAQFKHKYNVLDETIVEALKRSNNQEIFIGNGLSVQNNEVKFGNSVTRFNGNLQGNFHQISGNGPNQAILSYSDTILDQLAYFVGINLKAMNESGGTAYQTAVQQELSTKILNNMIRTRDIAYERLADIYLAEIMDFYTQEQVKEICPMADEIDEGTPEYEKPKIPLERKSVTRDEYGARFTDSEEDSLFELSPEDIREKFTVSVQTNLNKPALQVLEQSNAITGLQTIQLIDAVAKENEIVDRNKFDLIKDVSFKFGLHLDLENMNPELERKKKEIMDSMQSLVNGGMDGLGSIAGMGAEGEQPQGQPPEQPQIPGGQPPIPSGLQGMFQKTGQI